MLHNNKTDLQKVKFNLEEALYSQLLQMNQNSGRAGQFASNFVSIYDAVERLDKLIAEAEPTKAAAIEEVKPKTSKKDT